MSVKIIHPCPMCGCAQPEIEEAARAMLNRENARLTTMNRELQNASAIAINRRKKIEQHVGLSRVYQKQLAVVTAENAKLRRVVEAARRLLDPTFEGRPYLGIREALAELDGGK